MSSVAGRWSCHLREGRRQGVRHRQGEPPGADGMAEFPDGQIGAVVESAEECPGGCIFIEP
ncbi:MAG: ferredoxin [Ilumatobacteraceae bacterium]